MKSSVKGVSTRLSAITRRLSAVIEGNRSALAFVKTVKRNKLLQLSLAILFLLFFVAAFVDLIAPYSYYEQNLAENLLIPSLGHPLGTDYLGRDTLSRLMYGTRIILYEIALTLVISLGTGTILGSIAGYYGGVIDDITMRGADIMLSFPSLLIALAFAGILGTGLNNMILAIGITQVAPYIRLVRAQVLQAKGLPYVECARMMGANSIRLIFRHILPNISGPVLVQVTFNIANAVIAIASLSFLGFGAQPPTPCWGTLMYEGYIYMRVAPLQVAIPAVSILAVIFAFNVFGENLRDVVDPHTIYV